MLDSERLTVWFDDFNTEKLKKAKRLASYYESAKLSRVMRSNKF